VSDFADAYRRLLDAASGQGEPAPGEWNADQVLAHVSIISAMTIATVSAVAAGAHATYDNRTASDVWTLDRIIGRAGGRAGLRERLRRQGEALTAISALGAAELDTPVPTLLLSNGAVLVDQPLALREILAGLAEVELPGHTKQLQALVSPTG
jgi:hypothetical protein